MEDLPTPRNYKEKGKYEEEGDEDAAPWHLAQSAEGEEEEKEEEAQVWRTYPRGILRRVHKEVEDLPTRELWHVPKYAEDSEDEFEGYEMDSEDEFYAQCGLELYNEDGELNGGPGEVCAPAALPSFAPTIMPPVGMEVALKEGFLYWPSFFEWDDIDAFSCASRVVGFETWEVIRLDIEARERLDHLRVA